MTEVSPWDAPTPSRLFFSFSIFYFLLPIAYCLLCTLYFVVVILIISLSYSSQTLIHHSLPSLPIARGSEVSDTPSRSKWGETPSRGKWDQGEKTIGNTPGGKRSRWDETPVSRGYGTSTPGVGGMTPGGTMPLWQQEMAWRNRPLTDEELDQLLPSGYRIVVPPESYVGGIMKSEDEEG